MKINFPSDNIAINSKVENSANIQDKEKLSQMVVTPKMLEVQSATKFTVDRTINNLLKDLAASISNQEQLIKLLPHDLKKTTVKIFQQNTVKPENLPQGFKFLAAYQRNIVDKLLKLMTSVQDAQLIKASFDQKQSFLQVLADLLVPFINANTNLKYVLRTQGFQTLLNQMEDDTAVAGATMQYLSGDQQDELINRSADKLLKMILSGEEAENIRKVVFQQATCNRLSLEVLEDLLAHQNLLENEQENIKDIVQSFTKEATDLLSLNEKNNLSRLISAWTSIKLRNALPYIGMDKADAERGREILQKLAVSLQTVLASGGEITTTQNQKTLSLVFPFYFENSLRPYPAYIHVYHDRQNGSGRTGQCLHETWLRICVSTENMGIVDAVFHLYQENVISIMITFSTTAAVNEFTRYLPEIEAKLADLPLKLADITVK